MAIIYKILCEVQLLHEYYLTKGDGSVIFEGNANQRKAFLLEKFVSGKPGINADVYYSIPENAASLFSNYYLKLIPTFAGFKIAIKVTQRILAGGVRAYEPFVPLPDNLSIPIFIRKRSRYFDEYTNGLTRKEIPGLFYLTNDASINARNFPFLTAPVAGLNPAKTYEQGELATVLGVPSSFYSDNTNAVVWDPLPPGGYVNEADCILVSPVFTYRFTEADAVTSASFVLKDNGLTVQTINVGNGIRQLSSLVIYIDSNKIKQLPDINASAANSYTLEVTGTGGYSRVFKLLFFKADEALQNAWGLADIRINTTDLLFTLIDNAGLLITRRNPDNSVLVAPPVFEAWIKSRVTFWRYSNSNGASLVNGTQPDFLYFSNGKLISLRPRPVSYSATIFRRPDNTIEYLPNPTLLNGLTLENRKLYSDIIVPPSNIFPPAP